MTPLRGYVNLYSYNNGRLHVGTGVYPTAEIARDKAKHKPNYIWTTSVKVPGYKFKVSPDNGGFYDTNGAA